MSPGRRTAVARPAAGARARDYKNGAVGQQFVNASEATKKYTARGRHRHAVRPERQVDRERPRVGTEHIACNGRYQSLGVDFSQQPIALVRDINVADGVNRHVRREEEKRVCGRSAVTNRV